MGWGGVRGGVGWGGVECGVGWGGVGWGGVGLKHQLQHELRLADTCSACDLGDAVGADAAVEGGVEKRTTRRQLARVPRVPQQLRRRLGMHGHGQPAFPPRPYIILRR